MCGFGRSRIHRNCCYTLLYSVVTPKLAHVCFAFLLCFKTFVLPHYSVKFRFAITSSRNALHNRQVFKNSLRFTQSCSLFTANWLASTRINSEQERSSVLKFMFFTFFLKTKFLKLCDIKSQKILKDKFSNILRFSERAIKVSTLF